MPQKLVWTAPGDARLKRLRAEGHSWDRIAADLGISRNAAIERGRRIGARLPPPEHVPEPEDPDRPAMAPGHAVSWAVLIAGTCLEGETYPAPVTGTPFRGPPVCDASFCDASGAGTLPRREVFVSGVNEFGNKS